jgi:hypothetical protein
MPDARRPSCGIGQAFCANICRSSNAHLSGSENHNLQGELGHGLLQQLLTRAAKSSVTAASIQPRYEVTIVSRLLFALVAISIAPQQGFAASATGNALHEWCSNGNPMAIAFVTGAKDMAALVAPEPGYFCIPKGVTNGQIKDVVCKWLEDSPAERHKPAAYLTITALGQTWACN